MDLSSNILTGRIPPSIERLVALKELKITQNKINGPIPTGLYGISLFHFHASDNELTGTLPSDFGGMSHLKTLHLDKNKISGGIPLGFASLVSLSKSKNSLRALNNCLIFSHVTNFCLFLRILQLKYILIEMILPAVCPVQSVISFI